MIATTEDFDNMLILGTLGKVDQNGRRTTTASVGDNELYRDSIDPSIPDHCERFAAAVFHRLPKGVADRTSVHEISGQVREVGDSADVISTSPTRSAEVETLLQPEQRTDAANSRRLVDLHGDNLRWCGPWHNWIFWSGKRWHVDQACAVDRLAKSAAAKLWIAYGAALPMLPDAMRGAVQRFVAHANSARGINDALALAKSEVAITPEVLDRDIFALNVENGTLNLRTGELRPHDRGDFITKIAPVTFDASADCPTFTRFVDQIMGGCLDLVGYLRRLMGMSLTGDVSAQVLPFFYGTGANGKSTLLDVWLYVLGTDYAMRGASDLLMARMGERHPTERADLFGKRLVVCSEIEQGRKLHESLVKDLTGGDRIRARRMREDNWEFTPTHKLLICGNHQPVVQGTDHGIWRRIKAVPFVVTIPDDQQDKRLPEKLRSEASGILNWMLVGLREWLDNGLGEPEAVTAATAGYRGEQDVLGQFIADRCITGSWAKVKASQLYKLYAEWCDDGGEHAVNQRAFGLAMNERGFERYTNNGTWYRGITQLDTKYD